MANLRRIHRALPKTHWAALLLLSSCYRVSADERLFTRSHDGLSGEVVDFRRGAVGRAPSIDLRLGEGSRLSIRAGEEWRATTLEELQGPEGTIMDAVARHDRLARTSGGSGFEPYKSGYTSKLYARLRVHRDVPWLHVRWLMGSLAGWRINKLELGVGSQSILVFLPLDRSSPAPSPRVQATVAVLAQGNVRGTWGGARVQKPASVVYKAGAGGEVSDDLGDVARYLERAKRAATTADRGPLRAATLRVSPRTPTGEVLRVLRVLDKSEVRTLDLLLTGRPPSRTIKRSATLGYPDPSE